VRDLPRRTVTAVLYGVIVIAAVFAPPPVYALVLIIATLLSLAELYGLRGAGMWAAAQSLVLVIGIISLFILGMDATFPVGLLAIGRNIFTAFGYGPVTQLVFAHDVRLWLILAIGGTWAADVAAYLVGSGFGQHRIAPRISPSKTWEGTLAGFIVGGIAVVALTYLLGPSLAPYQSGGVLITAIGIGPVAFAGDLLESWVKRRAGVKDSGTMLPGHGGMLDRIDSLLTVAPLVVIAARFIPCCAPTLG